MATMTYFVALPFDRNDEGELGLEVGTKTKSGPTLHGLRKTLGKRVAEAGGSARMSGAILGHRDLQQVELYSREANKNQLARDGMAKVFSMVEERQKRAG